jgi:hypothetical protein
MKNNKQQTAVEWLVEQLRNNENIRWKGTILIELAEQAKEMERERIENAWIAALDFGIEKMKGLNTLESKDAFEKFYKTTYGGNK